MCLHFTLKKIVYKRYTVKFPFERKGHGENIEAVGSYQITSYWYLVYVLQNKSKYSN